VATDASTQEAHMSDKDEHKEPETEESEAPTWSDPSDLFGGVAPKVHEEEAAESHE